MKKTLLKYVALTLILVYQVTVFHQVISIAGHHLSHTVEWILTHQTHIHHHHHHVHIHVKKHHSDHEHPFWSAFEQFFETPSDENESAEAQNTVSDIKIDKHLYARNNRTYKAILKLIKGPKQEYNYKLATAWSEIPKPPPRNLLLIFYKI